MRAINKIKEILKEMQDNRELYVQNPNVDFTPLLKIFIEDGFNMLKKIFSAVILLIFCFTINFQGAEAKIDDSKIALGGIFPGETSVKNIISVYGEPQEKELQNRFDSNAYFYYGTRDSYTGLNKSVVIKFFPVGLSFKDNDLVKYITVKSNNGFSTPDGIKVGSSENELKQKYGSPDYIHEDRAYYYYGNLKFFRFEVLNGKVRNICAGTKEDYYDRKNNPMMVNPLRDGVPKW